MSATTIVWLATAVAFVVVLALAGAQAARALRELKRAKARVDAFAELPVVAALDRAQLDAQRLQTSLARIAPLVARAQLALAVIRRGPVSADLRAALARVRTEIAALRRLRA